MALGADGGGIIPISASGETLTFELGPGAESDIRKLLGPLGGRTEVEAGDNVDVDGDDDDAEDDKEGGTSNGFEASALGDWEERASGEPPLPLRLPTPPLGWTAAALAKAPPNELFALPLLLLPTLLPSLSALGPFGILC